MKTEFRASILTGLLSLSLCVPLAVPAHAGRLFTCGAEENNTAQTVWNSSGTITFDTAVVHSGTYSIRGNPSSTTSYSAVSLAANITSGTYFFRSFFRYATLPSATTEIMSSTSSTPTESISAVYNQAAGAIRLRNAVTGSTQDGSTTISAGVWYRVEIKQVIADTGGSAELKLFSDMGTTPLDTLTISNEDTLPSNIRQFYFGNRFTSTSYDMYRDDFAVNDSNGTFQNDYPGPGKIALLKPASIGTVTWTKTGANCSGTTNADCVDDEPGAPDDASGYNSSSTANSEDRLNSTSLTAEIPSNADMILLAVYDRWDGSGTTGTRQGRHLVWDESGAQTNGPTHSRCDVAAGSWSIATPSQITVFELGARSKANAESFDLGYEPLNNAECRVTAIWANIEWKPAPSVVSRARRRVVW